MGLGERMGEQVQQRGGQATSLPEQPAFGLRLFHTLLVSGARL